MELERGVPVERAEVACAQRFGKRGGGLLDEREVLRPGRQLRVPLLRQARFRQRDVVDLPDA